MKIDNNKIEEFKKEYKSIVEMEKNIKKCMKAIKQSSRKLYVKGTTSGCSEVKCLQKCFYHLDDLCFGEIEF